MITVSASQSFSAGRLAVALSYGIGSAARPLLPDARRAPGRRAARPPRRRPADRDGGGDGPRRPGDAAQLRHPLPEHDRRRPAELPRRPDGKPREHGVRPGRAGRHPRRLGPRRRRPCGRRRAAERGRGRPRRPAGPRQGAGIRRQPALVQHARRPAADPEGPARPRRPRRLLDLQLHQLPPHPALPEGLGRALPQGRADDRRRPHAGVPLRARSEQRRERDRGKRHPLSGRPGQRTGDLERLRQPVLAGRVLRRRPGATSATSTSARANTARKKG